MTTYADYKPLTFHDAARRFTDGNDSPRAYLERCLETIAQREPVVKALVTINETGARAAADASTARWKAGQPLSPIDGMPIGIKDLLETKDMPTEMGCAAMKGNFPKRDNAGVWALRQAGAVILAKTVTAELGGSQPGPTTNPFDQGAHAGRLVLGLGGRGGRQHDAGGDRHAGRRLDHPAGRLLRELCAEAHARRHQSRRAARHQPEHARAARRLPRGHVAGRDRDGQALRRRSRLVRPDGTGHTPGRDQTQPADRAGNRRLARGRPCDQGGLRPAAGPARGGRRHPDPPRRPSVRRGAGDRRSPTGAPSATASRAGRTAGTSAACSTPRPTASARAARRR